MKDIGQVAKVGGILPENCKIDPRNFEPGGAATRDSGGGWVDPPYPPEFEVDVEEIMLEMSCGKARRLGITPGEEVVFQAENWLELETPDGGSVSIKVLEGRGTVKNVEYPDEEGDGAWQEPDGRVVVKLCGRISNYKLG